MKYLSFFLILIISFYPTYSLACRFNTSCAADAIEHISKKDALLMAFVLEDILDSDQSSFKTGIVNIEIHGLLILIVNSGKSA